MSPENNEGIEGQVRKVLSGLGSANGEFLNQPGKTDALLSGNLGTLVTIWLDVKCGPNCQKLHSIGLPFEGFLFLFAGGDDPVYFDNFKFSQLANQTELASLRARCEQSEAAVESGRELIKKAEALTNNAQITNSHLQVENEGLRRQIAYLQASQVTETALDFRPARSWNIWTALRGIRLIGREGK